MLTSHSEDGEPAAAGGAAGTTATGGGGMTASRAASFELHLSADEARLLLAERRLLQEQREARTAQQSAEEAAAAEAEEEEAAMFVGYSGCYLDEDDGEDTWWAEAVLGRKVKRDQLYYKVKWRGRNLVTWERAEDIENRNAVDDFERAFRRRVDMPPTARRRFVPPSYEVKRIFKKGRVAASAVGGTDKKAPPAWQTAAAQQQAALHVAATRAGREVNLRPGDRAVWSCEVEPCIWIPYDDAGQRQIEEAYARNDAQASVMVPGRGPVGIDFATMRQLCGGRRRVQRIVQRNDVDERRHIDSLGIDELRRYIAQITDFTPVHYEALARLHEMDKVRVTASTAELDALPTMTFAEMMEAIINGTDFKAFSDECHICLDDYVPDATLALLPACGHSFHKHCIRDYFAKYSKLCPVCKEHL